MNILVCDDDKEIVRAIGIYLKNEGYRVLEAYDMTTEAVVAKLMWILGQTHDPCEVERLFYTPVAMDILWPV